VKKEETDLANIKMLDDIIDSLTPPPSPVPQTDHDAASSSEPETVDFFWGVGEFAAGTGNSNATAVGEISGGSASALSASSAYNNPPKWPSFGSVATAGTNKRKLAGGFQGQSIRDMTGLSATATDSSALDAAALQVLQNKRAFLSR
jgi:hypothetical protein